MLEFQECTCYTLSGFHILIERGNYHHIIKFQVLFSPSACSFTVPFIGPDIPRFVLRWGRLRDISRRRHTYIISQVFKM